MVQADHRVLTSWWTNASGTLTSLCRNVVLQEPDKTRELYGEFVAYWEAHWGRRPSGAYGNHEWNLADSAVFCLRLSPSRRLITLNYVRYTP